MMSNLTPTDILGACQFSSDAPRTADGGFIRTWHSAHIVKDGVEHMSWDSHEVSCRRLPAPTHGDNASPRSPSDVECLVQIEDGRHLNSVKRANSSHAIKMKARIDTLENNLSIVKEEARCLLRSNAVLRDKNAHLTDLSAQLSTNLEKLKQRLGILRSENAQIKSRKKNTLAQETEIRRADASSISQTTNLITSLKFQIDDLQRSISAKHQLVADEAIIAECEKSIEQKDNRIRELEAVISSLTARVDELQDQLDNKSEDSTPPPTPAAVAAPPAIDLSPYVSRIHDLEAENGSLHKSLSVSTEKNKHMLQQLRESQDHFNKLAEQLNAAKKKIIQLTNAQKTTLTGGSSMTSESQGAVASKSQTRKIQELQLQNDAYWKRIQRMNFLVEELKHKIHQKEEQRLHTTPLTIRPRTANSIVSCEVMSVSSHNERVRPPPIETLFEATGEKTTTVYRKVVTDTEQIRVNLPLDFYDN